MWPYFERPLTGNQLFLNVFNKRASQLYCLLYCQVILLGSFVIRLIFLQHSTLTSMYITQQPEHFQYIISIYLSTIEWRINYGFKVIDTYILSMVVVITSHNVHRVYMDYWTLSPYIYRILVYTYTVSVINLSHINNGYNFY